MIPTSAFRAECNPHGVDQRRDGDRLREDARTSWDAVFREPIKGVAGHEDRFAIRPSLAHQRGDVGAGPLRHDHVASSTSMRRGSSSMSTRTRSGLFVARTRYPRDSRMSSMISMVADSSSTISTVAGMSALSYFRMIRRRLAGSIRCDLSELPFARIAGGLYAARGWLSDWLSDWSAAWRKE